MTSRLKSVSESVNLNYDFKFFQQYIIIGKLGDGGSSNVYLCKRLRDKKEFAVKILENTSKKKSKIKLFNRELKALLILKHKYIIELNNLFIDYSNDLYYLVFELCNNGSLYDFLLRKKNNRIDEFNAFKIIYVLIDCIKYCHLNGIVHRDIKLENILINQNGHLKLCDFGFSHYYSGNKEHKMYTALGSPHYVAPEILRGLGYGCESDYWSIGVLLFALLTGELPFVDCNKQKLFKKILNGEFDFFHKAWTKVSHECKDFICRLLEVNPKKRLNGTNITNHEWIKMNLRHRKKISGLKI